MAPGSYGATKHPFTQIPVTDKGIEEMAKYVAQVREVIGFEVPLAADHYGHFDLNNAIRLGKGLEYWRLAWLEDLIPWQITEEWKKITAVALSPSKSVCKTLVSRPASPSRWASWQQSASPQPFSGR